MWSYWVSVVLLVPIVLIWCGNYYHVGIDVQIEPQRREQRCSCVDEFLQVAMARGDERRMQHYVVVTLARLVVTLQMIRVLYCYLWFATVYDGMPTYSLTFYGYTNFLWLWRWWSVRPVPATENRGFKLEWGVSGMCKKIAVVWNILFLVFVLSGGGWFWSVCWSICSILGFWESVMGVGMMKCDICTG